MTSAKFRIDWAKATYRYLSLKVEKECGDNQHSYEFDISENLKDSCLEVKTVIGGVDHGLIVESMVYEDEVIADVLRQHQKDVLSLYKKSKGNIPKDR